MDSGGGGGGGQNTVTQTQQIPEWQQGFARENQAIASSLASQPYPTYAGQIVAGFSPQQQAGMGMTGEASTAWQPGIATAEGMTMDAASPWNPAAAMQYMSPFAMAALAPQLQQIDLAQAARRKATGAAATRAGAFGDARHGVENVLGDFYGDLARSDVVARGMESAYGTGLSAFQQDMARRAQAGGQMAQLARERQGLGLEGANALFNVGTQDQQ